LISILTASLLTFVISPEEVGAYNLVLTIVAFGALVGALGLPKTVVRLVAENMGLNRSGRTRRVIYTVLGLGVAGTLLTSLAYYLVIGDIVEGRLFDSPLLLGLTGLIAVWIAIAIVQEITAETFRGFHDLRWATLLGGLATGGKSGGLIMKLMLLGGPILGLLFNQDIYSSNTAWLVLLILSAAKLVAVWSGSCGLVLQFTGHQGSMLRVSLLTSPLFFVLAIFAVTRYGPVGVAAAAAITTSLQNVIMVLLAKRKTGMWTHVSFSLAPFRKGLKKDQ
jgi:O-antigen/teichoic acid export membrane protein